MAIILYTFIFAGVPGHEDEELGAEPDHASHRHRSQPHRLRRQRAVRRRQAHHLLIGEQFNQLGWIGW